MNLLLEGQTRAELELAWIVRGRRCSSRGVKEIHVENVKFVDQIEDIRGNQQRYLMREGKALGDAQVREDGVWLYPGIAWQVTVEVAAVDAGGRRSVAVAGQIQISGRGIAGGDRRVPATCPSTVSGYNVGAIGKRIEVEVCVGTGQDVERPA